MLRVIRYLHKRIWIIVAAVLFIACEAAAELQLPGCLSKLVDIGVQNRGIEHPSPERITESDLILAARFMNTAERALAMECYSRDPADPSVLLKKTLSDKTEEELDHAFGVADWTIIYVLRDELGVKNLGAAAESTSVSDVSDVDMAVVQDALSKNPDIAASLISAARAKALCVQPSIQEQTGCTFAAAFYSNAGGSMADLQTDFMIREGTVMMMYVAAAAVAAGLGVLFAAKGAAALAAALRCAVFAKVYACKDAGLSHRPAQLLSRTTNDITLIQNALVEEIRILVLALCTGIGGIIMAAVMDLSLMWTIALAVVVIIAVVGLIFVLTKKRYPIVQNMIDRLNLVTREDVEGAGVVRMFHAQKSEEKRYDKANDRLASVQLGINRILIFIPPVTSLVMNVVSLLIVWVGAGFTQTQGAQVGDIIAYMQYAIIVLTSFVLVGGMFVIVSRASVASERVLEVLGCEPRVKDLKESDQILPENRAVGISHVTIPGDAGPVLEDVSLRAEPGKVTAVVGGVGSGKTMLAHLIESKVEPGTRVVIVSGGNNGNVTSGNAQNAIERKAGEESESPEVYIADDPMSGLTPKGKAQLRCILRNMAVHGTAVLLFSRSALDACFADRIYVLAGGRITAEGTHVELLESSSVYRSMLADEDEDGGSCG